VCVWASDSRQAEHAAQRAEQVHTSYLSEAGGMGTAALLAVLSGSDCSAHPRTRPAQDRPAGAGETRGVGWALLSALGTLLLNHLQLRLCRVHLRFHVRSLRQLPAAALSAQPAA
jgi:hypothetical protein